MKKLILICAVVGLLLMNSVPAMAQVTIDFESLGSLVVVDNQFLALGADFNGSATILSKAGGTLNWPAFPPYSGDKVIYDWPELWGGVIRVDAVGLPWSMAGGYVTGNRNVTLTAYASDGTVLDTDQTGGANTTSVGTPNMFLSVTASNIAYVEFNDAGNTYTVDDFTFQPIPAPGAILLGSIGVGLVGGLRRRRTF